MPGDDTTTPVEILLVEDTGGDAEMMIEALRGSDLSLRVHRVEDGEEALAFLRRQGDHATAVRPDLILLDLHLPRMNGYEVLAEIEQDDSLRQILVVVMASLEAEQAFRGTGELRGYCRVCKPDDFDEATCAVKKIEHFWLHHRCQCHRSHSPRSPEASQRCP